MFAYALTRTALPLKGFFRQTVTFPVISRPFIVTLSAILLFGRTGSLTPLLHKLFGEYSIYGLGGLVFVETIAYGPTAFLVLYGVLQAIDPASAPLDPSNLSGRTGRGDTCLASYMAWRPGHGAEESLRFAAALTSTKVEKAGPFDGTIDEVLKRMRTSR